MSRYILIRRLRGPAFLLLVGLNALLAQAHILGWGESWPFYLILAGLLMLAERAALAAEGYPTFPGATYPGSTYPGAPYAAGPYAAGSDPAASQPPAGQQTASAETAIVPRRHTGFDNDPNGGGQ
jgi:hypothetical protein